MLLLLMTSCMKWDYGENLTDFSGASTGLFIICEGNFQYGNATLSFYDPKTNTVENEIFFRANGMKLGDVAQSMTIYGDRGWIVVNNSHVVFAIDVDTYRETGRIENLTSPRYIHFINEEKAYVTQIWDNRIFIVNPKTYSISGYITVPDMPLSSGSTEQMVDWENFVFCNCWSYQNKIIKIDTETDEVVGSLSIGIQPNSLVIDKKGRLWTITDGGFDGSPYGYEVPSLYCIDPQSFTVTRIFEFELGSSPSELQINGSGDTLYWLDDAVWRMDIDDTMLPSSPFIPFTETKFYGLTVDPLSDEVYVADAIDFSQQGMVYRYSPDGLPLNSFYVGVTPGAFCWKR